MNTKLIFAQIKNNDNLGIKKYSLLPSVLCRDEKKKKTQILAIIARGLKFFVFTALKINKNFV